MGRVLIRDALFLSAPTPILGGAKEKFCIGNWGCRGRISGPEFIGTIDDGDSRFNTCSSV